MQTDLGSLFQLSGIDTNQAFSLQPAGKGHVLASSTAQDKAKIDGLFSDNPQLVSRFMVMAARGALSQAAETSPAFAAAYEQDPVSAIKQNIGTLKNLLLGFQLQVKGGEMTPGWAGQDAA